MTAPAERVLVLDAGNSAVKAVLYVADTPVLRLPPAPPGTDYAAWLHAALAGHTVHRAGLSTVVPALAAPLGAAVRAAAGVPLEPVSVRMRLPFAMQYATPETLGQDRLAGAVAAWERWGGARAVVAVDAGTAVTYDVVAPAGAGAGAYLGGAIAPGPVLMLRALAAGTAQLPNVPAEWPADAIGRSTREALQCGAVLGFADAVSGMLRRLRARLGTDLFAVATGGWAETLAQQAEGIDAIAPDLVLDGVRRLLARNPRP